MHCLKDVENLQTVITIGNFDGVHIGHRALLRKVIERAKSNNVKSAVITFNMHPYHLLYPHMKPYLLTSPEKKEELLLRMGIDYVCSLDFTPELAEMSAQAFLKDIIIERLRAIEIVLGYDARFGKDREGNYNFLLEQEKFYNYKAIYVESLVMNDRVVSSSLIRQLIRAGEMEQASQLLESYYSFKGTVVHGKQIGHKTSFPTLNIVPETEHQLIPATGIYVTGIHIAGSYFWGVTNIGYSPTLKTEQKLEIEMFVFDFNSEIYGQSVEIYFYRRLRDEEKYSSADELVSQIKRDVELAKELIPQFSNSKYFGSKNG
ncbi:MAG: bifunctional riboflavin kinase/FAD synthetase [Candidatus Cloacimonetes bacterium]|nr:bifunctional riboflavin kinase/FAD synthetase [Candidatus Cloacimonadota bacterium]